MRIIHVNLPQAEYSYPVIIGSGIIKNNLAEVLAEYSEPVIFVVTNETVNKLHSMVLSDLFSGKVEIKTLVLPDGESHKHLGTIASILDFLAENRANRKSLLIAFGGGVIGDMTGFAAAIFMRGMRYIQIPTTLLSQVDSSIGGKTGVNHRLGKNLIGAFKQPLQTIIDTDLLKTLPSREFVAGYAELIKHGFIRDEKLFQTLRGYSLDQLQSNTTLLNEAIYLSCRVKAAVVEEDEKENGLRAVLNFGHTIGHFLETITGYNSMLHGEAVIIGMDFATWWSYDNGLLGEPDFHTLHHHLKQLGITHRIKMASEEEFIEIIEHDKKSAAQGIRFIGLTGIGQAAIYDKISAASLWESYQRFLQTDTFLKTASS
jgi:3-dehydroquinate synthase